MYSNLKHVLYDGLQIITNVWKVPKVKHSRIFAFFGLCKFLSRFVRFQRAIAHMWSPQNKGWQFFKASFLSILTEEHFLGNSEKWQLWKFLFLHFTEKATKNKKSEGNLMAQKALIPGTETYLPRGSNVRRGKGGNLFQYSMCQFLFQFPLF